MGTSNIVLEEKYAEEDHPHAYGDKTWTANTIFGVVGSSPRVWGQVNGVSGFIEKIGIIPTRMGTSRVAYKK